VTAMHVALLSVQSYPIKATSSEWRYGICLFWDSSNFITSELCIQ